MNDQTDPWARKIVDLICGPRGTRRPAAHISEDYYIDFDKMSDAITMDQMAQLMRSMGLAGLPQPVHDMRKEITHLRGAIGKVDGRAVRVETEVDKLKNEMEELRQEQADLKQRGATQAGASQSAAPRGLQAGAEGLHPRAVHIRGWAPYGAPESSKLMRSEADALQREIEKHFDQWLAQKTNWLSPLMKNHTVSLEVLDCGGGEAKRAADRINLIITEKKIQVKGGIPRGQPRATCESQGILPREGQILAAQRSGLLVGLRTSLGALDKTQSRKLGWFNNGAGSWCWKATAVR